MKTRPSTVHRIVKRFRDSRDILVCDSKELNHLELLLEKKEIGYRK